MDKEIVEISNTQLGDLRNSLHDANIMIHTLNVTSIIHCIDLDPDFVNALDQLFKIKRQPTKKRFDF